MDADTIFKTIAERILSCKPDLFLNFLCMPLSFTEKRYPQF